MRSAMRDAKLTATLTAAVPLLYDEGGDAATDRPGHVRAGSGMAKVGNRLALIQDDANFIALVGLSPTRVHALALPTGEGGKRLFDSSRGNKSHKLDLEACFSVPTADATLLVAMGSGSTEHGVRQNVALVRFPPSGDAEVRVVHLPQLYDSLRGVPDFAGSEMNIEGAVHLGDRVRLFGRGNGAARDGMRPVNATCELDWAQFLAHTLDPSRDPPRPKNVVRYELGDLDGVPLGFTDATISGGNIIYGAAAEASPDVYADGPVAGSAIGVIDATGHARWTAIVNPDGSRFDGKVEGVLAENADRLTAVVDADNPNAPSQLCTIELSGAWY